MIYWVINFEPQDNNYNYPSYCIGRSSMGVTKTFSHKWQALILAGGHELFSKILVSESYISKKVVSRNGENAINIYTSKYR
jgi:hypothetical protein